MKFSILQQDYLPVLQSVGRSVGVRSTLPVLDNVLLSLRGNKLSVSATNLEIGVIKQVSVEGLSDGDITIPAKTLTEIISGLVSVKIDLEADAEILSISAGKFKASVNGIGASEFPVIPLSDEIGVEFPKEIFLSLSSILFASATDEGRPVLTGVLTESKGKKIDFVATDGFRLAHKSAELLKQTPDFKNLIPKKTFEEVIRIIAEEDSQTLAISASANQNQAIFTIGNTTLSSRLIEGNFPAWQKIIPEKFVSFVSVDKDILLRSIKLASIFAKNEANIVVFKLSKDKIGISSFAKELGSQENEIEADVKGEDMQVAFNAKFLLDVFSASPPSGLTLEFSGPLTAVRIKPVLDRGLEYIIMPVRLS